MELTLVILSLLLTTSYAVPVLDGQGNELKRGHKYYVLPAIFGPTGGGLKLVPGDGTCPLYVAREESEVASGLPVLFFPENPDRATVQEGGTLYAMFAVPTECSDSTVWRFEENAITTGGKVSSSIAPHFSRFAISRGEFPDNSYKIQSCPCSVDVERPSCRLACSEVDTLPASVVFIRADDEGTVIA